MEKLIISFTKDDWDRHSDTIVKIPLLPIAVKRQLQTENVNWGIPGEITIDNKRYIYDEQQENEKYNKYKINKEEFTSNLYLMENQQNVIPKPIVIFRDNGSIRRIELPKIPLYGRYNPIPREERISKITGEKHFPFNKQQ